MLTTPDHSLSDIQWWQDTLNILYSDNKHQIPGSIAHDMKTLMAAFAETYLVNHKLRFDKTDQAFEFLRLYAVFRKGIINLAERLWPQVDMQPLRDQV